mmetsp:Transcript_17872/g.46838  ORF Transcript_17872/g.46838 Transcript_17872/m.46838 type:complete len:206 (-) Transcript_17872:292-909(-)
MVTVRNGLLTWRRNRLRVVERPPRGGPGDGSARMRRACIDLRFECATFPLHLHTHLRTQQLPLLALLSLVLQPLEYCLARVRTVLGRVVAALAVDQPWLERALRELPLLLELGLPLIVHVPLQTAEDVLVIDHAVGVAGAKATGGTATASVGPVDMGLKSAPRELLLFFHFLPQRKSRSLVVAQSVKNRSLDMGRCTRWQAMSIS